ncbi:M48 family metalloprotease [Nocardia sp.]|uniref:M48 family metalloprotease n=1 Tax=Nocardia sp. TaxID=1821 RepID=UPI0026390991|nr:M48 family metalloprotease [Nocardia sp.]
MLIVSWPVPVLIGLLLARLGALVGDWLAVVLLVVWLVSATLLLLAFPRSEEQIADYVPRRPNAAESEVLNPAWHETMCALGLGDSAFSLWVRQGEGPTGGALPGGMVVLSAAAVPELPPEQLRGLLAHEIGHLLGSGGVWWWRLAHWYAIPLRLPLAAVTRFARLVTSRSAHVLQTGAVAAGQLGVLIGLSVLTWQLLGSVAAIVLLGSAGVQRFAQLAISRRSEFAADQVVVDVGYGAGWRAYLAHRRKYDWMPVEIVESGSLVIRALDLFVEINSTHPSVYRRIREIAWRWQTRQ